jgi:hypothetical protein
MNSLFELDPNGDEYEAVNVTVNVPGEVNVWVGFCETELSLSPNAHNQDIGLPVEVSVNWTVWPTTGEAGVKEKFATASPTARTVTDRLVELDPTGNEYDAANDTVNVPGEVNVWVGFCETENPPSPNAHSQDIGPPVEESVNWTVWPTTGDAGAKEKFATPSASLISVRPTANTTGWCAINAATAAVARRGPLNIGASVTFLPLYCVRPLMRLVEDEELKPRERRLVSPTRVPRAGR